MSLRGGYQIINLKMKEFSSSLENYYRFPELFEDVKNGNAKMIILSGLNLDGVKYRDYEILIYEVNEVDTPMYYQAILRRMWNTRDYKVITKYLNIYPDDRVNITMEENIYEILPDGSLSLTSENAVQNKVITDKINSITSRILEMDSGSHEPIVYTTNIDIDGLGAGERPDTKSIGVTFTLVGNVLSLSYRLYYNEGYVTFFEKDFIKFPKIFNINGKNYVPLTPISYVMEIPQQGAVYAGGSFFKAESEKISDDVDYDIYVCPRGSFGLSPTNEEILDSSTMDNGVTYVDFRFYFNVYNSDVTDISLIN